MQFDITFRDALPVLAALAGVIVGGVIAELRTLLRGARERRRALRTLLHHLLELRFRVVTQDPRPLLPILIGYLKRRFSPEQVQAFESSASEQILRQVFAALVTSAGDPPVIEQYERAIEALAPHDPILAYRLSNQSRLPNLEHELMGYYAKLMTLPQLAQDAEAVELLPQIESASVVIARSQALDQLAESIRDVASEVSWSTRRGARQVLQRQDEIPGAELDKILDQFVQTAMRAVRVPGVTSRAP